MNYGALGYQKQIIRGYEVYVIEGPEYILNKTTFKKKIFSRAYNWRAMPIPQFRHIPLAIYLKTYADVGYVSNYPHYEINSRLTNKLLSGVGMGIDIVGSYDMVFRFEYTYNAEGNRGFFFNIKKYFLSFIHDCIVLSYVKLITILIFVRSKNLNDMKNIAVIGSGTMGNGIAHSFAQHGYTVTLIDIAEEALKKALATIDKNLSRQVEKGSITEDVKKQTLANITTQTDLKSGVSNVDLVVEAATENTELKLKIFQELDAATAPHTILATNTSSISITKIASVTKRADKVIGMHFMNPVPIMKLVEVIRGYNTSDDVTQIIMKLSRSLEKIPVEVNDYPGFIANRILMPMINEAIYSLYEGVAGVEEIDSVMKLGMAHPMGPLQLADFIGLDVCLSILNVLYEGFGNPKYAPCPLLVNMVQAGHKGAKSGSGFYTYVQGSKDLKVSKRFEKQEA